jgi:orotate phosphoribosyltransferase
MSHLVEIQMALEIAGMASTVQSISEQFLSHAIGIRALEFIPEGRKLKSGRLSPYFFNSGLFTTGYDLAHLATAYTETIEQSAPEFDVIFGLAYKGIPLATCVATMLAVTSKAYATVAWCFNRKERKDHGEGGLLVGANLKGKRVLIIDDVITDGASKREAVRVIQEHGGTPVGCVIAFDRQERGMNEGDSRSARQSLEDELRIPIFAVATLDDLIEYMNDPNFAEMYPKILAYRDQYGCAQ